MDLDRSVLLPEQILFLFLEDSDVRDVREDLADVRDVWENPEYVRKGRKEPADVNKGKEYLTYV